MSKESDITILPYQQLDGLVGQSEGHGVFIDCGGHHMNVGAIFPLPDGRYLLNLMIMTEMQVPRFKACDFTDYYDSMERAADAAREFLEMHRDEKQ